MIMIVIREKETIATKKTKLIFETKLQGLQSSHVSKNQAGRIFYV